MYTPSATTFTALFRLQFRLETNSLFSNSFFQLEVSRELPQRSTLNTSLVAHNFSLFFCVVFNPVFSYIFVCVIFQPTIDFVLFQTCHTFINRPLLCPTVASNSYSSWNECPSNLWTLPTFSDLIVLASTNLSLSMTNISLMSTELYLDLVAALFVLFAMYCTELHVHSLRYLMAFAFIFLDKLKDIWIL